MSDSVPGAAQPMSWSPDPAAAPAGLPASTPPPTGPPVPGTPPAGAGYGPREGVAPGYGTPPSSTGDPRFATAPAPTGDPRFATAPAPTGDPRFATPAGYPGGPATHPAGPATYPGGPPAYPGPSPYGATTYPGPSPYGAPAYGYAQPPWGAPPSEPYARASLITGIVGFVVGIAGPVAIFLGASALRRIRTSGAAGRGMAVAGIWCGSVATALTVIYVVFGVFSAFGEISGVTPATLAGGTEQVEPGADEQLPSFELYYGFAAGSCLTVLPGYDMRDTTVVDCTAPHAAEVIGVVELTAPVSRSLASDGAYEGALDQCYTITDGFDPDVVHDELYVELYFPHPDQWDDGGRSGYCVVDADGLDLTGSLVAGTLTPLSTGVAS